MGHEPNFADHYRRAACHVDRILEDAKPADLPSTPPYSACRRGALTAAEPDGMMPPREGLPMERRSVRLSRWEFMVGAGVSSLSLLAGCARLPFQQPTPTAMKIHR